MPTIGGDSIGGAPGLGVGVGGLHTFSPAPGGANAIGGL